jgi:hypothetical protein
MVSQQIPALESRRTIEGITHVGFSGRVGAWRGWPRRGELAAEGVRLGAVTEMRLPTSDTSLSGD